MIAATTTPKMIEYKISLENGVNASSWPPLKPMANKRYRDMNLLEECGISRSLFTLAAMIPNTKKSNVGLVMLDTRIWKSMAYNWFGQFPWAKLSTDHVGDGQTS